MKKQKRVLDKHLIAKANAEVEVPRDVWRFSGIEGGQTISLVGTDISFGGDYGSLDQCRSTIEWYVTQLGGQVKWEEVE